MAFRPSGGAPRHAAAGQNDEQIASGGSLIDTTEETLMPARTHSITDFGHHDLLLPDCVLTGHVVFDQARNLLKLRHPLEGDEVLNVDLTREGYVAFPGELFLKDWSEHSGLCGALVDAGIVERLETLSVGPFDSRAYRVRVLTEAVAR